MEPPLRQEFTLHPFMHTFALGIALPHVEVGQEEKSGD